MTGLTFAKPEPIAKTKRREKRLRFLARRKCREAVYQREQWRCQRCGKLTKAPEDCSWGGDPDMAHVNEPDLKSGGADQFNPDECELVCGACHFPGGQHAPTPERMRTIQQRNPESRQADGIAPVLLAEGD